MGINNLFKDTFVWEAERLQKGQRIMFDGEEAEVISLKPILVIKTKNEIVCGDIRKKLEHIKE